MSSESSWAGSVFEVRLGPPGHGGFCVARHEGRVLFVRHGLPGEYVRARVTEDRGGSFCRAEAIEILEASPDRVPATCPVSGPGGAGCCDFSFATPQAQRALKAAVVSEQLRRLAGWDAEVEVEPIPDAATARVFRRPGSPLAQGTMSPGPLERLSSRTGRDPIGAGPTRTATAEAAEVGWRTRVRLVVDETGRAGVHGYRSTAVIPDLRCPQPVPGAMAGIADSRWTPGAELVIAVDGDGRRHVVEIAPAAVERGRAGRGGRRSTAARRAATHSVREQRVVEGTGRAVEYVAGRRWEVATTGFWQPHRGAALCYSDVIADWAATGADAVAWDLYAGAGVFAARLAEQVGPAGAVAAVESAPSAVADGAAALRDLPWVDPIAARVEHWVTDPGGDAPEVVVLDPPRAGAGKDVIAALAAAGPARIVHVGCDPAAFARDIGLYRAAGYRPARMRAFDAFPATHHVECLALLEPVSGR
ncbi:class I SAM-dependent RNA methyltransferase [Nocardia sp. alder85J]|uniref:class I SAM-dependent RNA methyltransferase n=1 Tax=Nocardia sp. alder85J TaxID=2862949 RepID=UPI001CD25785|nr:TRAM domain-containing protein [Nocardia sp. alder85J]MCX4094806.1 TRAM domain-containing protein [Nocardia sp. alder85J]